MVYQAKLNYHLKVTLALMKERYLRLKNWFQQFGVYRRALLLIANLGMDRKLCDGQVFDVLFDNGVLKTVFHRYRPHLESAFWKDAQAFVPQLPNKFSCVSSPLMLIEALGRKLPDPYRDDVTFKDEIDEIIKNFAGDSNDLFTEIVQRIELRLKTLPELSIMAIQNSFEKEVNWRSPKARGLFRSIFEQNLKDEKVMEKRFYWELAVDRLQTIDFQTVKSNAGLELIPRLTIQLYLANSGVVFNVPFGRILTQLYCVDEANRERAAHFGYENVGQSVDTQIIYLLTTGHKRDGKVFPIICFTCESLGSIRARVEAYQAALKHFGVFLLKETGAAPLFCEGLVVQIDQQTGNVRDQFILPKIEFANGG